MFSLSPSDNVVIQTPPPYFVTILFFISTPPRVIVATISLSTGELATNTPPPLVALFSQIKTLFLELSIFVVTLPLLNSEIPPPFVAELLVISTPPITSNIPPFLTAIPPPSSLAELLVIFPPEISAVAPSTTIPPPEYDAVLPSIHPLSNCK